MTRIGKLFYRAAARFKRKPDNGRQTLEELEILMKRIRANSKRVRYSVERTHTMINGGDKHGSIIHSK